MFEQSHYRLYRAGTNMGAQLGAFYDLIGIPYRGGEDLCPVALYGKDTRDLTDQLRAFPSAVIDPADERGDIGSAGFCRQQRLARRKNQGTIRADALSFQPFDGFHAVFYHGNLYHDPGMEMGKLLTFRYNFLEIGRQHFR